jgi:hypothetical protein
MHAGTSTTPLLLSITYQHAIGIEQNLVINAAVNAVRCFSKLLCSTFSQLGVIGISNMLFIAHITDGTITTATRTALSGRDSAGRRAIVLDTPLYARKRMPVAKAACVHTYQ